MKKNKNTFCCFKMLIKFFPKLYGQIRFFPKHRENFPLLREMLLLKYKGFWRFLLQNFKTLHRERWKACTYRFAGSSRRSSG